ncbi:hypothetical protein PRIPAC_89231 [Pristionchus pacificus]|uniref:Uncharacterized protein n=1 Tax=Pristionchus pacificus TaxID=54126 RepID=A0A2A6B694_PRIPA|nr:hypothetical protein PRIPAC_89231 [Pristionchus pacificus]|eukprot:PDM61397.1 hypothetical protein PRIPAC_50839 [Pristionchus pacificus]
MAEHNGGEKGHEELENERKKLEEEKAVKIAEFLEALKGKAVFFVIEGPASTIVVNRTSVPVARQYIAEDSVIIHPGKKHKFETVDVHVHFAPYLSDDNPYDGVDYWKTMGLNEDTNDEFPMPNLIYYKDNSGVVSGPLKEEEATALYKGNFFRPEHVFRIVDANNAETFTSIDRNDMKLQLNESAAKVKKYEHAKERLIAQFKSILEGTNAFSVERCEFIGFGGHIYWRCRFHNKSYSSVYCMHFVTFIKDLFMYNEVWILFYGFLGHKYLYIAPHISDDPLDGSEHVRIFPIDYARSAIEYK